MEFDPFEPKFLVCFSSEDGQLFCYFLSILTSPTGEYKEQVLVLIIMRMVPIGISLAMFSLQFCFIVFFFFLI